jgi:hypothetical protein
VCIACCPDQRRVVNLTCASHRQARNARRETVVMLPLNVIVHVEVDGDFALGILGIFDVVVRQVTEGRLDLDEVLHNAD